jgi:hypothetical protein
VLPQSAQVIVIAFTSRTPLQDRFPEDEAGAAA